MNSQGNAANPQPVGLDLTRQGNQDQGCTSQGPGEGMGFIKKFSKHYFLRERERLSPLEDEDDATAGAANITPVAAIKTLR